ncbi:prepilin peptidase [Roseomonas sp. CAU 1739]|uniref:A24 family peptidase n=1 Tax=Roseomonas sp. CAU 1739 TaxID=3140364 RepID=UPI00325BA93B
MTGVLLFQVVAAPFLIFAAARDIATRLIPDGVSIAIALAGLASRLLVGWTEAGLSLAIGCLLFAILLPLAVRGWLGGGDVKLMSAMAVGLAPHETWSFIVATVFSGGALGIAYIIGRHIVPETRLIAGGTLLRRVLVVEAWRVRRRGPLPYAVAIAVGGLIVLYTLTGI